MATAQLSSQNWHLLRRWGASQGAPFLGFSIIIKRDGQISLLALEPDGCSFSATKQTYFIASIILHVGNPTHHYFEMRQCMAISLEGMSHQELQALIDAAQKQSTTAAKERISRVREKINALLKKENLSFEDVFGIGKKTRRSSGPIAAKYANPSNPSQTWTGRGLRPAWFKDALAKGASVEKLMIGDAGTAKTVATKKSAARKGASTKATKKVARKATKKA